MAWVFGAQHVTQRATNAVRRPDRSGPTAVMTHHLSACCVQVAPSLAGPEAPSRQSQGATLLLTEVLPAGFEPASSRRRVMAFAIHAPWAVPSDVHGTRQGNRRFPDGVYATGAYQRPVLVRGHDPDLRYTLQESRYVGLDGAEALTQPHPWFQGPTYKARRLSVKTIRLTDAAAPGLPRAGAAEAEDQGRSDLPMVQTSRLRPGPRRYPKVPRLDSGATSIREGGPMILGEESASWTVSGRPESQPSDPCPHRRTQVST